MYDSAPDTRAVSSQAIQLTPQLAVQEGSGRGTMPKHHGTQHTAPRGGGACCHALFVHCSPLAVSAFSRPTILRHVRICTLCAVAGDISLCCPWNSCLQGEAPGWCSILQARHRASLDAHATLVSCVAQAVHAGIPCADPEALQARQGHGRQHAPTPCTRSNH